MTINFTSSHFLHYVVYMCQKSKKYVDAFMCYKQKCKVVSLNLAHPVEDVKSGLVWVEVSHVFSSPHECTYVML